LKYAAIIIECVVLMLGVTSVAMAVPNSNSIIEDGIEYYIQTDKAIYNLGDDVEMLFRVTNLTDSDVQIGCSRSGEFNLLVEDDDNTVWAAAHWFLWFSPGIELSSGESINIPYIWDMLDDNDNLVTLGIYDVVGLMYNEPWNYYNHGEYVLTEVAVPINIIPEPTTILLLSLGAGLMVRMRRPRTSQ
jgi:hypothetical protein